MVFFRTFWDLLCRRQRGGQVMHGHKSLLLDNLWVILFIAIAGGMYWHGMCEKETVYTDLKKRLGSVQHELYLASVQREELLRQIQSQSDPEWIELILMKRLGLAPEGQVKVYFEKTQP